MVNPEEDSKNAAAGDKYGEHSKYGSPPKRLHRIQPSPTITIASRFGIMSFLVFRKPGMMPMSAQPPVMVAERKSMAAASASPGITSNFANSPHKAIATATSARSRPRMRAIR